MHILEHFLYSSAAVKPRAQFVQATEQHVLSVFMQHQTDTSTSWLSWKILFIPAGIAGALMLTQTPSFQDLQQRFQLWQVEQSLWRIETTLHTDTQLYQAINFSLISN